MPDLSFLIPDLQGNLLDLVILGIVVFYAYEGYVLGFVAACIDLVSFLLSFIIALKGYSVLSPVLVHVFNIPPGFANAIAFFLTALFSEIALSIALRKIVARFSAATKLSLSAGDSQKANHLLGILPGIASSLIILSFLLTLVTALPSSPFLKDIVGTSYIGSRLVTNAAVFERRLNDIFGGALHETLNFLTIEPQSNETIILRFTVTNPTIDSQAEQKMWQMVNRERELAGLRPLEFDNMLASLARNYSRDMFVHGYFSHHNPQGDSPFDRMGSADIRYLSAGENLALAPSVEIAMRGLMDSPGHRANILSENFHKVGIGVMDGGIYGKMFTQEFTD